MEEYQESNSCPGDEDTAPVQGRRQADVARQNLPSNARNRYPRRAEVPQYFSSLVYLVSLEIFGKTRVHHCECKLFNRMLEGNFCMKHISQNLVRISTKCRKGALFSLTSRWGAAGSPPVTAWDRAQERMRAVGSSRRREDRASHTPALSRSGEDIRASVSIRLVLLFLLDTSTGTEETTEQK